MALPAPRTLSYVRDEVFTRCNINTGGDRGARALKLVDSCIRRAVQELAVKASWLRLSVTEDVPLTSGAGTYDFPDSIDPGRTTEIYVRHATSLKLHELRADPSMTRRNALINSDSRPQYYWFENEVLNVTPTPDVAYYNTLVFRGFLRVSDLVNDTDLIALDGEAVIQRAEIHLRPRIGLRVSQDMKETHLAYLRDVRGTQTENSGSMPGGDTSIRCMPEQDGSFYGPSQVQWDEGWQPPGYWGN